MPYRMMTSSNGNIFRVTGPLCGEFTGLHRPPVNSPASGEIPAQRPVTWSLDVFFDLCLNKRLRKQSWGWWFETLSHPLWRHCNEATTKSTYRWAHCMSFGYRSRLVFWQPIHGGVKPPLHRAATFVPPLSVQKNVQDAQWSPKPKKFSFCVTAAARPLCLPWTTKSAVVAQQVAQTKQSGGRTIAKVAEGLQWSRNGVTVVATVIAQWTLFVGQRRHNGSTRKAEALLKLIHNVHNSTYFLRGDQWPTTVHPFCHHGDVCAPLLPPLSDPWATDLLGDLCATVVNMLKTSWRPWRPWRCLNVLCTTIERPRQPFCLLSAFNGDLVSFVVAQWRQKGRSPCVKGVLPRPVPNFTNMD